MLTLLLSIVIVIVVSGVCSLAEAALYAVRMPYVRQLAESGSKAGARLAELKRNIERPITAILVVNTAAHTAGAAIAGAQALELFGEASVVWFSVGFTLAVLFLSEILPKIAGVAYSRTIARAIAAPLHAAIVILYPAVWLTQQGSRFLQRRHPEPNASEEDVEHMAAISAEEGSILPVEAQWVKNALRLNRVTATDIMTPYANIYHLPSSLTVREVAQQAPQWRFARIPVHPGDSPGAWNGVILRRDVLARLAADEFETTLKSLSTPLDFVPDSMPAHLLLREFLRRRKHLFGVRD